MTPRRTPSSTTWLVVVSLVLGSLVIATSSTAGAAEGEGCIAVRQGQDITLTWTDEGGRHVIRRDAGWLATPGTKVSIYVDQDAPVDASYTVRTRQDGVVTDQPCSELGSPGGPCTFTRVGSIATIEWSDNGGNHVLRRNGDWLTSPGARTDTFVDQSSPIGSTYELLTRQDDELIVTACHDGDDNTPPLTANAERVIHVSIDGLRVDTITAELMPNLSRLITEGASTMNARTDPRVTRTLPNHTSQFTGVPVKVHGVDYNEDLGRTVHDDAGRYVPSVFDVVHDNGGRTVAFVGKSKFFVHDRSWDGVNGAADVSGVDDGRDKIDRFEQATPEITADMLLEELAESDDLEFAFFHIRYPDRAGHDFGWSSDEYLDAVSLSDDILGRILGVIDQDPALSTTTSVIVVADHGGPTGGDSHADPTLLDNYTIPFVVWGPTVAPGSDLYALNAGRRADPGDMRVWLVGTQPIRGHEVANLALDFLGYPPVNGSTFNAAQDLAVN